MSQKRGIHGQIKKELGRQYDIEPVIGHRKTDGHPVRNFLKGRLGEKINAIINAVGYNLHLNTKWLRKLLRQINAAIGAAIASISTLRSAS